MMLDEILFVTYFSAENNMKCIFGFLYSWRALSLVKETAYLFLRSWLCLTVNTEKLIFFLVEDSIVLVV